MVLQDAGLYFFGNDKRDAGVNIERDSGFLKVVGRGIYKI